MWMTSHSEYSVSKGEGLEPSPVGIQYLMPGGEKPKRKQKKTLPEIQGETVLTPREQVSVGRDSDQGETLAKGQEK